MHLRRKRRRRCSRVKLRHIVAALLLPRLDLGRKLAVQAPQTRPHGVLADPRGPPDCALAVVCNRVHKMVRIHVLQHMREIREQNHHKHKRQNRAQGHHRPRQMARMQQIVLHQHIRLHHGRDAKGHLHNAVAIEELRDHRREPRRRNLNHKRRRNHNNKHKRRNRRRKRNARHKHLRQLLVELEKEPEKLSRRALPRSAFHNKHQHKQRNQNQRDKEHRTQPLRQEVELDPVVLGRSGLVKQTLRLKLNKLRLLRHNRPRHERRKLRSRAQQPAKARQRRIRRVASNRGRGTQRAANTKQAANTAGAASGQERDLGNRKGRQQLEEHLQGRLALRIDVVKVGSAINDLPELLLVRLPEIIKERRQGLARQPDKLRCDPRHRDKVLLHHVERRKPHHGLVHPHLVERIELLGKPQHHHRQRSEQLIVDR
eukprot:comp4821_c0_seq1/m.3732 comp4821_c0_seq1/g.3732  ORF comp4821_c0_seq1/g.3732 comp4821_c0_seq1/m.3732 type:complete len:429 (+) comp4821_c0_seq1:334-1620(+)